MFVKTNIKQLTTRDRRRGFSQSFLVPRNIVRTHTYKERESRRDVIVHIINIINVERGNVQFEY